jgi:DNA-binding HxlR family transcriptional regulator
MKKKKYNCPAEMALERISGKWKIIILWNLRKGALRFGELKRFSPGITQMMLTQQLKSLEGEGIVLRHVLSQKPLQVEYSLSPLGQSLKPVLYALVKWGLTNQSKYTIGDFGMAHFQK